MKKADENIRQKVLIVMQLTNYQQNSHSRRPVTTRPNLFFDQRQLIFLTFFSICIIKRVISFGFKISYLLIHFRAKIVSFITLDFCNSVNTFPIFPS